MDKAAAGAKRIIEAEGLKAQLIRTRRRSVSLQLLPDLELLMRAPLNVSESFLVDFLDKRRAWVQKHRARLEALKAADPGPIWASGGAVPFLGEKIPLEVRVGRRNTARLRPEGLLAIVPDASDSAAVRSAVERLYVREAARRFPAMLESCMLRAAQRKLPYPELRLRMMRSRWGSCDPAKKIVTLNIRLLRFSPPVIEYVIMHELAHLRHRGHDARFYALLERLCPDWRELRRMLAGVFLD
ncbi:MAG TPA: SprT family zinc-dependent metalloprotease [Rectinemataceae bacterium]|nr:SprT family zinc-dependent metalloprotease [Rectinemataceae bacterium]